MQEWGGILKEKDTVNTEEGAVVDGEEFFVFPEMRGQEMKPAVWGLGLGSSRSTPYGLTFSKS